MSLHVESRGRGRDLVMLHGWGMHSGVWGTCHERLASRYRVTLVDLPGHGRSSFSGAEMRTLSSLAAAIAEVVPAGAIWLGWSLGGMVALRAATDLGKRVAGLVVVATNPSFVRRSGWPWAQEAEVLDGFARDLEREYRGLLLRFLALQTRGSEGAHPQLRILRKQLFSYGKPDLRALAAGLELLKRCDLRRELSTLALPALVVAGSNDTLVPAEAAVRLAGLLANARLEVIAGAGHAPFLSHPDSFCEQVEAFIDGRISAG